MMALRSNAHSDPVDHIARDRSGGEVDAVRQSEDPIHMPDSMLCGSPLKVMADLSPQRDPASTDGHTHRTVRDEPVTVQRGRTVSR